MPEKEHDQKPGNENRERAEADREPAEMHQFSNILLGAYEAPPVQGGTF